MTNRLLCSLSSLFNGASNIYFPSLLNVGILQRAIEVRFASTVDQQIVDSATVGHTHTHLQRVQLGSVNQETQDLYNARLLKIAIIGVPNVGKSTIINQLVGRRICSISSKVHTTRCKARAIAVHGNTQLVFLDTPGLVTSDESQRHHLERAFHLDSEEAMLEADAIGVVHDVSNTWTRERLDPMVLRLLHLYPEKHSFLIINKIDVMKSKRKLLDIIRILTNSSLEGQKVSRNESRSRVHCVDYMDEQHKNKIINDHHNNSVINEEKHRQLSELQIQRKVKRERGWSLFKEVFMLSALSGSGVEDVKNYLLHISKPSPWLYPASQYTDQPSETVIVNIVKSKLLDHLPQEIPYNLTTVMEYYDVGMEGTISAVVLVGCPTHRIEKLLVGSHGLRIRAIAREAEQELQDTFRQSVRLKVVVTNKNHTVSGVPSEN